MEGGGRKREKGGGGRRERERGGVEEKAMRPIRGKGYGACKRHAKRGALSQRRSRGKGYVNTRQAECLMQTR